MQLLRKAKDRGLTQTNWLTSYHSFSFADYHDMQHMRFGNLRVINDDTVLGNQGFAPHTHQNMEILSIVVNGDLEHKDDMGNHFKLGTGDVQLMSAGTGVTHSEWNPGSDKTRFLQIWVIPNQLNIPPAYGQTRFTRTVLSSPLQLIASPRQDEGALLIRQNIDIFIGSTDEIGTFSIDAAIDKSYWFQIIDGSLTVNDTPLEQGDGLGLKSIKQLNLSLQKPTNFILFIQSGREHYDEA